MSGLRSRGRAPALELAVAKVLQANGFSAAKISRAYQAGHDIVLSLTVAISVRTVKARADGFQCAVFAGSTSRDLLIVKADRQEPLVILRLSLATQIVKAGSGTNVGLR